MSDKPVTLSSDEETGQSSASLSAKPPPGSPPKNIKGPVSFAVQVGDRVLKRHADQLRIAILPATAAAASSSTSDDQDEQPSPPSST
ncbi:unnamed protein product [Orchesella dallaii]|uniref:Uncharacterized protein n=1 Tax=Orchesella dallaii TaxID=48710 RepID=A0ABP1RQM6_9HEXA